MTKHASIGANYMSINYAITWVFCFKHATINAICIL